MSAPDTLADIRTAWSDTPGWQATEPEQRGWQIIGHVQQNLEGLGEALFAQAMSTEASRGKALVFLANAALDMASDLRRVTKRRLDAGRAEDAAATARNLARRSARAKQGVK